MSATVSAQGLTPGLFVPATADRIPRTQQRLDIETVSARRKADYYVRHSFDPASLLIPLLPATILQADPPGRYPSSWRQGPAAFGRNFGDALATEQAANAGKFLTELVTHEDPRYYPCRSRNAFVRTVYALGFTLVDRSDQGSPRVAWSNFAGAEAAGFVGRAYLPAPYQDVTHAEQRALGTLGGYVPTLLVGYATGNLVQEWSPELKRLGDKLLSRFRGTRKNFTGEAAEQRSTE